jgi:hypothetical protein
MGIGLSILLIAAGAILTFAVDAKVSGIDLDVVGWVLMGAGVLGLIWSLVLVSTRRREVVVDPRHSAAHVVTPVATAAPVVAEPAQPVRTEVVDDPRIG